MLTAGSPRTFISSLFVKKSDLLKTWSSGVCWKEAQLSAPRHPQRPNESKCHFHKPLVPLWFMARMTGLELATSAVTDL